MKAAEMKGRRGNKWRCCPRKVEDRRDRVEVEVEVAEPRDRKEVKLRPRSGRPDRCCRISRCSRLLFILT